MSDLIGMGKLPPPPPTTKERLAQWWRKRISPLLEAWLPLVSGILVLLFVWFVICPDQQQYLKLMKIGVPTAVSVAAILAGFQGTIHAILLTMMNSRVVRQLKKGKHYDNLIDYVDRGIVSLLLFVVVSLAMLGLELSDIDLTSFKLTSPGMMAGLVAGLFTYSMSASLRIIRMVVKMLRITGSEKND